MKPNQLKSLSILDDVYSNTITIMRKLFYLIALVPFIYACGVDQSEYDKITKERDELAAEIDNNIAVIEVLRDSIKMLSFPADQRLNMINSLVSAGDYTQAKQEISRLTSLFPESKEAQSAPAIVEKIDKLIAQKKAEEERIKALGFKALKASTTFTIDYNKVELTSISVGNTFTFDSYGDRYFYRSADRGNKYITAAMKITSDSKDPKLPQLAVYKISGDSMTWEGNFKTEFARWDDYGSYLGNDHDFGNDFAKTSSVRFKIGKEVEEEIVKGPYALIMKKENALNRNYERFDNPPISYIGSVDYSYSLKLEDFTKEDSQYIVVKIANL